MSDNGVGVAQDAGLQKTDTLGLQLVNLLVDQLGGSLTVQRCGPTRFEVRFAVETEPEPAL